jgi:hypothetical protein
VAFDLNALLGSLTTAATAAGPSQTALDLRRRTLQRAMASRAQRAQMMQLLQSSGFRPGGGGGSPSSGGGGGGAPRANLPRGRGLTTITAPNGQRVTVSATYANRFSGLLNDLWKAGYKFKSVGGYSYRNIAGTNTLSKHAHGEAIDIDPQPNRGDRLGGGGAKYGYFNPSVVNAIVRRWGLDWGANWRSADPMHFSTGG